MTQMPLTSYRHATLLLETAPIKYMAKAEALFSGDDQVFPDDMSGSTVSCVGHGTVGFASNRPNFVIISGLRAALEPS
jgi:hypothetical protein